MKVSSLPTMPIIDLSRAIALVKRDQPDWNPERVTSAADEYRRVLRLCKTFPDRKVSAPPDVDKVWHAHMLDSVNYMADCDQYFGYYLHHDPCVSEESDIGNAMETLSAYEDMFGVKPPTAWQGLMTCANPGGGCGSIRAA